MRHPSILLALVLAAALAAGCGSGEDGSGGAAAAPGAAKSRVPALHADAAKVTARDFQPASGRSLTQIAAAARSQAQVGLASSVLEPGTNRVAFGVLDPGNNFLYGRTAVYVASSQRGQARGPYPAPADTLLTKPAFRSQTAASERDPIAAIYGAEVPFRRAGRYVMLVLTKTPRGTAGGLVELRVVKDGGLPRVGEKMPPVKTETLADAGGDEAQVDTRIPPAPELHQQHLTDVLGKRPVALLIATPQLCQSRVCGPVVDIALQMKAEFGDRIAFIHQEVYRDNEVAKGLREPLLQLHLETEPWLLTVRRDGTIAARVEGSFGVDTFRAAVESALR